MTTLKELLALNQQIVGLRRTGSPVTLGLPRSPSELEARLNQLTSELSSRAGADVSYADANDGSGNVQQGSVKLQQRLLDSDSLPEPYQQTVEVGIREGRLSAAFEGITESGQMADQLRRDTWVALAYPILVTVIAFIFLGMLAAYSLHQFGTTHYVMRIPKADSTRFATSVSVFGWLWALVPVVFFVLYFFVRWIAAMIPAGKSFRSYAKWLPGYRRFDHDLRLANFADTILQLRRNGVPNSDAISLASSVSGHKIPYAKSEKGLSPGSVPPLLRWALFEADTSTDDAEAVELDSLAIAADMYCERAVRRSHNLSRRLPVITCVAVGIVIVLTYALTVWLPFCNMLNELSAPVTWVAQ